MRRYQLAAARDTWGKHCDELYGAAFEPYMLHDLTALTLLEVEEGRGQGCPWRG